MIPDIAIITSLDSDHLDIYGSYKEFIDTFQKFASQVKKNGYLILEESIVIYLIYLIMNMLKLQLRHCLHYDFLALIIQHYYYYTFL